MLFIIMLLTWLSTSSAFAPEDFMSVDASISHSSLVQNKVELPLPFHTSRYHQQGIQALSSGGWAVSGSDVDTGYLYFSDAAGSIHTVYRPVDDALKYNHPGGFQIADDILAIGLENADLRKGSYSKIVFLDVSESRSPTPLDHLEIERPQEAGKVMTAGAVGMTRMDSNYLVVVGNWDSERFDFYRSVGALDLRHPDVAISSCFGNWSAGEESKPYQNINLYPGGKPKTCYLIGMYSVNRKADWADLWLIDFSNPKAILGQKLLERQFTGNDTESHFVQGGGTYFDPTSGRFSIFAVDGHLRDGHSTVVKWE